MMDHGPMCWRQVLRPDAMSPYSCRAHEVGFFVVFLLWPCTQGVPEHAADTSRKERL
jgi:hypothetical protein